MKKTFMFIAAALVVMAACNKVDTPATKSLSFNATVEQHEDVTKTYLDGTSVKWTANDEIAVFDNATTPKKAELKTTLGDVTSASFNVEVSKDDGFEDANASWAIYPYAAATSATSAGVISFTVDGTQTYVKDSFDPEHNVMVGKVQDGNIAFKNAFGLLKLQLKGVMKVGKIELTGGNSEKLYGTFTANAASDYTAVYSTGGGSTITLDCTGVGGVQLDAETATAFYFVVPAGAFGDDSNGGFTATVYDIADYSGSPKVWNGTSKYNVDVTTTKKTNVIYRTRVRAMEAVGVSLLTDAYTEYTYISSQGKDGNVGAYINTGIAPKASYTYDFSVGTHTSNIAGSIFGSRSTGTWNTSTDQVYLFYRTVGSYCLEFISYLQHKDALSEGQLITDRLYTFTNVLADGNTVDGTQPIYIFGFNLCGTHNIENGLEIQVGHLRITDGDGTPQGIFIAAKKGDDYGMYDVVSGNFVSNAAPLAGNFGYGSPVSVAFHK